MKSWSEIPNLSAGPDAGDPSFLVDDLVRELRAFVAFVNTPVLVTSGYRPQSQTGQHPLGRAVDVIFPKKKRTDLMDMFFAASRFNFRGVGVYPDWKLGGVPHGGLHLDVREAPAKSLWVGSDQDGKQVYLALTVEILRKSGVI